MVKNKKDLLKGLGLVAMIVAAGLAGALVSSATMEPNVVDLNNRTLEQLESNLEPEVVDLNNRTLESIKEHFEPKVINNTEIKEVEVIKEVDNENLDLVLNRLIESEGDFGEIVENLEESNMSKIVDRIELENDFKGLSLNYLNDKLEREVSLMLADTTGLKEFNSFKIVIDEDSYSVNNIDYEDKNSTVKFDIEIELYKDKMIVEVLEKEVELDIEEFEVEDLMIN